MEKAGNDPLEQLLADIKAGIDNLQLAAPKSKPVDYRGQFHDLAREAERLSERIAAVESALLGLPRALTPRDLDQTIARYADEFRKSASLVENGTKLFVRKSRSRQRAMKVGLIFSLVVSGWVVGLLTADPVLPGLRGLGVTSLGQITNENCERFGGRIGVAQTGQMYCASFFTD